MKRGLYEGLFLTIFNSIYFLLLRLYFTRVLDTYPNTGGRGGGVVVVVGG